MLNHLLKLILAPKKIIKKSDITNPPHPIRVYWSSTQDRANNAYAAMKTGNPDELEEDPEDIPYTPPTDFPGESKLLLSMPKVILFEYKSTISGYRHPNIENIIINLSNELNAAIISNTVKKCSINETYVANHHFAPRPWLQNIIPRNDSDESDNPYPILGLDILIIVIYQLTHQGDAYRFNSEFFSTPNPEEIITYYNNRLIRDVELVKFYYKYFNSYKAFVYYDEATPLSYPDEANIIAKTDDGDGAGPAMFSVPVNGVNKFYYSAYTSTTTWNKIVPSRLEAPDGSYNICDDPATGFQPWAGSGYNMELAWSRFDTGGITRPRFSIAISGTQTNTDVWSQVETIEKAHINNICGQLSNHGFVYKGDIDSTDSATTISKILADITEHWKK